MTSKDEIVWISYSYCNLLGFVTFYEIFFTSVYNILTLASSASPIKDNLMRSKGCLQWFTTFWNRFFLSQPAQNTEVSDLCQERERIIA